MGKPVCDHPRQPTGPSGFGGSGVRRAQDSGGDYQRTHPGQGVTSIQSEDFSRVIVDNNPEYVTTAIEDGNVVARDTLSFRLKFLKSVASKSIPLIVDFGEGGLYIGETLESSDVFDGHYSYETYPGNSESVTIRSRINVPVVKFGGYYSKGRTVTRYITAYSYLNSITSQSIVVRAGDPVSYWGKHPDFGRCAVSFTTRIQGRADSAGRTLHDVTLIRHVERGTGIEYPIVTSSFTRPDAEFASLMVQSVLKDYTIGIFTEKFFRPGPTVPTEDYKPKFWVAATPNNKEFGTFTLTDISSVFNGAKQPTLLTTPVDHYSTTSGRQYDIDMSYTLTTMTQDAVAENSIVLAFQERLEAGWVCRAVRIDISGGNAAASITHETAPVASQSNCELWQNVAYLGNGVVLAKVCAGHLGIDHTITFRRSIDGGQTWSDPFSPSGFDAPLLNQYFGNFRVNKAVTDKKPGRVLIVSWDTATSAYYVYSSEDKGSSWTKKAKVYKPNAFLRIDSMMNGDGGNNFVSLVPGPVYTDKIDVTLPDRYKERS